MAETIAAVSIPTGAGGIGIVKVSGPASLDIMKQLKVRCLEAVCTYFQAPASYTGEDMLEIQSNDRNLPLRSILDAVLGSGIPGVGMAKPGEFTKRAFLNGKMDLAQAEAVMDTVKAKSDLAFRIAKRQLEGRLSEVINAIRNTLMDILAEMALNIDYPEEDSRNAGDGSDSGLVNQLRWVISDVEDLLDTASIGRIAREGIKVVIVGKPNTGKTSLKNAIFSSGHMIETDALGKAGEKTYLGGVPILLVDIADLRDTYDKDGKTELERIAQAIAAADIVIMVVDGSGRSDMKENAIMGYIEKIDSRSVLVVLNKEDKGIVIRDEEIRDRLPEASIIRTSLVGDSAVEAAKLVSGEIGRMSGITGIDIDEMNIVSSERHVKMLSNALMNLDEAVGMLQRGDSMESAELSARYAYDCLGKIVGDEAGDDILNTVFSKFSLGE